MSEHKTIASVIERCKSTKSKLAVFVDQETGNFIVLFADTVMTRAAIRNGFVKQTKIATNNHYKDVVIGHINAKLLLVADRKTTVCDIKGAMK